MFHICLRVFDIFEKCCLFLYVLAIRSILKFGTNDDEE